MIPLKEAVIAKLEKGGENFEILVHPERALDVKRGKEIPIEELVGIDQVFEDSSKGLRASEKKIKKVFKTDNFKDVVYQIIKNGEIHLTTQQKKEMRERKRKEIADIISRRGYNPRTNAPNPPNRILKAMDEAGVHVNEFMTAEQQVNPAIQAIRHIVPISIETLEITVKIPPRYTGKAYGVIKNFGDLKKEEWKKDGSWVGIIEIPAGLQSEFYDKINFLTRGEAITKKV